MAKPGLARPGLASPSLDLPGMAQIQYVERFLHMDKKMRLEKSFRMHKSKASGKLSLSINGRFGLIVPCSWVGIGDHSRDFNIYLAKTHTIQLIHVGQCSFFLG